MTYIIITNSIIYFVRLWLNPDFFSLTFTSKCISIPVLGPSLILDVSEDELIRLEGAVMPVTGLIGMKIA